jgi:hypothetical protein
MIVLMICRRNYTAPKTRSMIKIMSTSYRISAPPKYGCNFSGIAIEPSAC